MHNNPDLNKNTTEPEVMSASYRILENAFGKNEFEKGDATTLKKIVEEEILKEYPNLSENPGALEDKSRYLASNFFKIVANLPKSPGKEKYHQIVNKFAKDSLDKYLASMESGSGN